MLQDKNILVTGAGRGIGRGIALMFAQYGANVAVSDIDMESAEKIAGEIRQYGVKGLAVKCDVSDQKSVSEMMETTWKNFGAIDVLVNNAGVNKVILIEDMTEKEWDRVFDINMKGVFLCTKAVVPFMRKKGSGIIINMASAAGKTGGAKVPGSHYAASKAGIICFTKSSAREFAKYNVRINAIAPGLIVTEMTNQFSEEEHRRLMEIIPMGTAGTVEDVSRTAVYLASDLSSYVTGQTIPVNGGMWMDY